MDSLPYTVLSGSLDPVSFTTPAHLARGSLASVLQGCPSCFDSTCTQYQQTQ